jgi:hypothetical protein
MDVNRGGEAIIAAILPVEGNRLQNCPQKPAKMQLKWSLRIFQKPVQTSVGCLGFPFHM